MPGSSAWAPRPVRIQGSLELILENNTVTLMRDIGLTPLMKSVSTTAKELDLSGLHPGNLPTVGCQGEF